MASEARVTSSLQIKKGNLEYQSKPTSFTADVTGTKGPVPGAVAVSTTGTDVSLAELTTPGLVRLSNLDSTNYYEFGIYEPSTSTFYPLGEVLPGETFVFRFSRNLLEEYVGTGTSAATNTFRLRANTAAVVAVVEAFEK